MIASLNCAGNMHKSTKNHENPDVSLIGQGEAIQRKYNRLKPGGGQVYHRLNV
jgi:hypothetical protein